MRLAANGCVGHPGEESTRFEKVSVRTLVVPQHCANT
jgi:hypothetical protein